MFFKLNRYIYLILSIYSEKLFFEKMFINGKS